MDANLSIWDLVKVFVDLYWEIIAYGPLQCNILKFPTNNILLLKKRLCISKSVEKSFNVKCETRKVGVIWLKD